jgi:histidinol-phosphate/aromatic aminotransferase/cobyric acid decarboxylase-like protein
MYEQNYRATHAFHGGRFFDAIGTDFCNLERAQDVISADVLDAWFDPSPRVIAALREHLPFLSRTSPPAYADGLIRAISRVRGVPPAHLCAAGGSSQLIFTCLPVLVSEKSRVLILDPMYGEYAHVLENVLHCDVHRHFLREEDGFRVDPESLLEEVRRVQPDLVIIVNPNSPSGQHWPRKELSQFLRRIPHVLCLVDETYIDYVSADESLESAICDFPNLMVTKSMSKVYALSGLRAAYMAASEELVRQVARRLPPWSVSLPAQVAAVEALADPDYYQARYQETHSLRDEALRSLYDLPEIKVFDSCASFYMIKSTQQSASSIQQQFEKENIFVRHCDSMSTRFHDNFLRIAVKSEGQNCRIVAALTAVLSRKLARAVGT